MKKEYKKIIVGLALILSSKFSFSQSLETVTIGTQTWMASNLNVDKFRNGDPIPQAKTDAEWIEAAKNRKPA